MSSRPILSRLLRSRPCPTTTATAATTRICHPLHTLSRPTLRQRHHAHPHPSQPPHRTIFIQTEQTPNPSALKFLPGTTVLPASSPTLEYLDARSAHASPLARKLFAVPGVRAVFYGPDFITVTKSDDMQWAVLKPEVFALVTEALNGGESIVVEEGEGREQSSDTRREEGDSEVVGMIKELLETRVRPAIQEDGGDIEYRGFEDGQVLLKLRGACRTCDSSTVTLKNGIESMLMHYIEEVQGVTQILDPEEEIAVREFEKFEEKLKQVKGPAAVAGTGKGGLDSAEA